MIAPQDALAAATSRPGRDVAPGDFGAYCDGAIMFVRIYVTVPSGGGAELHCVCTSGGERVWIA